MPQLQFSSTVEAPVDEVFAWHDRLGALQRLLPPWEPVSATSLTPQLATPLTPGNRVKLTLSLPGALGPHWIAEHTRYDPPHEFREVMAEGPLRSWEHTHRFEAVPGGTRVIDELEFELPFGSLGQLMEKPVSRRLRQMFAYRHRQLAEDMAAHAAATARGVGRLRIAISGSSGLIGSALSAFLTTGGHAVTHLVRREAGPGEISWDPASGQLNPDDLVGYDAVIHLAGAAIGGRWTAERRRAAVASRVGGTHLIASALATLAGDNTGPGTLICGSAIGLYGPDRGPEALTESSGRGTGFLADLVSEWERATESAEVAGIRVVHARTGIVQSPSGGTLGAQLPLFRLGLGGTLSRGEQWLSWIGLD
ncbi:MAG: SRPBCC family protein, partial [Mycobacteriales bacterium]